MVRTKVKKEASFFAVLSGALAAAVLGILLGFAYEVARPPVFGTGKAAESKAEESRSPLFRTGGTDDAADWSRVVRQAAGGESGRGGLVLTEGDLNRIAGEFLDFSAGKEQARSGDESDPFYAILPDTPNFALGDARMRIAVPFDFLLLGFERKAFLVLEGSFREGNAGPAFRIREAWINSARLPALVADAILQRFASAIRQMAPDSDLVAAWGNIGSIAVDEREMVISLR